MNTRMLSAALAIETIVLVTMAGWIVQSRQPSNKPVTSTADLSTSDPRTRHRHWKYQPQTKTVTVVGEVVDSWCYSSQVMGPGRGERHKACALACAHGGVTIGIVDDEGTLYICAKHKAYTGCKELLMPFVAKRVKVIGWLAQKGGCNVLKVAEVQEVKEDGSSASSGAGSSAGSGAASSAGSGAASSAGSGAASSAGNNAPAQQTSPSTPGATSSNIPSPAPATKPVPATLPTTAAPAGVKADSRG